MVTVPETQKKSHTIHCDICGIELEDEQNERSSDWNKALLTYADGGVFSDDEDFRHKYGIDLCMKCARDKVIPIIEKEFNIKRRDLRI